jgi:hypothetical protein
MKTPVSHLKDSTLQKAPQALMRAAEQTGTPLVVRRHGAASVTVRQK